MIISYAAPRSPVSAIWLIQLAPTVTSATPGMAVVVSGWKDLPEAGEEVLSAKENDIKRAITNRQRREQVSSLVIDAEAINEQRQADRKRRERLEQEDKRQNMGVLSAAAPKKKRGSPSQGITSCG